MKSIVLMGETLPVALPGYTVCEELRAATAHLDGPRVWRLLAACIALCTAAPQDERGRPLKKDGRLVAPIARRAGADYAASKCDPLVYGGVVYEWLRLQGVRKEEISAVGTKLLELASEKVFPADAEVHEAAGFSGPTEE